MKSVCPQSEVYAKQYTSKFTLIKTDQNVFITVLKFSRGAYFYLWLLVPHFSFFKLYEQSG